jgi:hypothetical protein
LYLALLHERESARITALFKFDIVHGFHSNNIKIHL